MTAASPFAACAKLRRAKRETLRRIKYNNGSGKQQHQHHNSLYLSMNLLFTYLLTLFTLFRISGVSETPQPTPSTSQYCNTRFGYCIDYLENVLIPQEEAFNGDGRKFTNKQGEVILTVFGRLNRDENGDPITLQQQFANDISRLQKAGGSTVITYRKKGNDYYIISGTKGNRIFYHKMIIKQDAFCFAFLEYPKSEKQVYDPYSTVVFNTFK